MKYVKHIINLYKGKKYEIKRVQWHRFHRNCYSKLINEVEAPLFAI